MIKVFNDKKVFYELLLNKPVNNKTRQGRQQRRTHVSGPIWTNLVTTKKLTY